MPIFQLKESKLVPIKEKAIQLEKDVQKLTESNLETLFNLKFVRTEFPLQAFRIDTLAFDDENKAFVIIEYKRDRSFSVIDQGYAYLALMLNNKADFILEFNERTGGNLKKDDVDWSQSRVIFIAQSFTAYQQNAINFKDLPIELWEVKIFDNTTILYNQLIAAESKESIKTVTKDSTVASVAKEVKVYTVEDHLSKMSAATKSVFDALREAILALPGVQEIPRKHYVAYKTVTNFADIIFYKSEIRVALNLRSGELRDPKNLAIDFTKPVKGHWGNGDYEITVRNLEDITYAMLLIEQSYKKSKQ